MFQKKKVVHKIKTHFMFDSFFFFWEKYGGSREATDDNIIQRMRFA